MSLRLRHALALGRDWLFPGEPLAQWTHFVTSTCNAKCAHCFYPINQKNNELTLEEIDKLASTMPPIRLLLISGGVTAIAAIGWRMRRPNERRTAGPA